IGQVFQRLRLFGEVGGEGRWRVGSQRRADDLLGVADLGQRGFRVALGEFARGTPLGLLYALVEHLAADGRVRDTTGGLVAWYHVDVHRDADRVLGQCG